MIRASAISLVLMGGGLVGAAGYGAYHRAHDPCALARDTGSMEAQEACTMQAASSSGPTGSHWYSASHWHTPFWSSSHVSRASSGGGGAVASSGVSRGGFGSAGAHASAGS